MQRSYYSDCKRKPVVISIKDFRNSSIWWVKLTGVSSGDLEFSKYRGRRYGISIGEFKNSLFTNSDDMPTGDDHHISRNGSVSRHDTITWENGIHERKFPQFGFVYWTLRGSTYDLKKIAVWIKNCPQYGNYILLNGCFHVGVSGYGFNNSLYIIQPSNTTSNMYLIINEWATSFGH